MKLKIMITIGIACLFAAYQAQAEQTLFVNNSDSDFYIYLCGTKHDNNSSDIKKCPRVDGLTCKDYKVDDLSKPTYLYAETVCGFFKTEYKYIGKLSASLLEKKYPYVEVTGTWSSCSLPSMHAKNEKVPRYDTNCDR